VTSPLLVLDVAGVPVPQGSKRAFRHSKTGRVVMVDDNPALAAWRDLVAVKARAAWAGRAPLVVPVRASLAFYLPRPAGHFGTGRNAGRLKDSAPFWPAVKPDLDKLTRAVFDALETAGVWGNDSRCCWVSASKNYADPDAVLGPGLGLTLEGLEEGAE
jgi:Holliday junction resolvase RusA-like endonuclease